MTPQERRRRLEELERRLGVGRGAGRVYLCGAAGNWIGDPPPDDADLDEATVICIDFIKPPDPADSPPRPHLEIVP